MIAGADPRSPAQLDALTGLRGIAAWFVVLYHARLMLTGILPGEAIGFMGKGYLAVDLFFMLSGFVMWYNYAPKFRALGLAETPAFLWRRMARIWPLHAVILAAMAGFALVLVATGRGITSYPFAELPLHLTLTQNWGFTSALSWNHPAWSISTELAAYLVFPLAVCAVRWENWRSAALLALIGALLAALHLVFALNDYAELGDAIPRLGLPRCLLEFAIGNLACILWQRWRNRPGIAPACAIAASAALGLGTWLGWAETAFIPFVFAAGLMALALDRGAVAGLLGAAVPRWLGEISYSTYLAHFFLLILYKIAFVDETLQMGWVALGGYLLLVLLASAVLFHVVEKPAQRWLNMHRPSMGRMREAKSG